jgi:cyclophilin family peptidyl-prolyl cis-trans isomerase
MMLVSREPVSRFVSASPSRKRCTPQRVLVACLLTACACSNALAQLTPQQTYYGVNRPVRITVAAPSGAAANNTAPTIAPDGSVIPATQTTPAGESESASTTTTAVAALAIELIDAGPMFTLPADGVTDAPQKRLRASVQAGTVDLAQTFPTLWADPHNAGVRMRYVQLYVNDVATGPALVLQPLSTPARAELVHPAKREVFYTDPSTLQSNFEAREGQIVWSQPMGAAASLLTGLRVYVDQHVLLTTSVGEVEIRLQPQAAPNTVWNFRELVKGGFYSDVAFHRIVAKTPKGDPFVVQGGDPTATGEGGPGFDIALEPSPLAHDFGVVSMARDADPDTNGSQFFVCLSREGTKSLDGKYTAFGEVIRGLPTLLALEKTPVRGDRPIQPPVLQAATLIDAPPRAASARGLPRIQRPLDGKGKQGR